MAVDHGGNARLLEQLLDAHRQLQDSQMQRLIDASRTTATTDDVAAFEAACAGGDQ